MRFPTLAIPQSVRQTQDTFGGYNAGLRIGDGQFSDMRNLTSDYAPILATRQPRHLAAQAVNPQGILARDNLCCVDGTKFVINGLAVDMNLSTREADCPKHFVSMGAYVIILPDKKYINTVDLTDFGPLEAQFESAGPVTLTPCGMGGSEQLRDYIQAEAPENPENMQLWLDTSAQPHSLKQWSAASSMWVNVPDCYVKISCPGIGAGFREYDGVTVAGLTGQQPEALNGSAVLWAVEPDAVVIAGLLDGETKQASVSIRRTLPKMDYVIECGNRLWGCRYGIGDDGQPVNEIYASKLGDFRNWHCYMGLATDSYAVSLGSDGSFTGAIAHLGYPVFFKENCLHRIYGSYPANFFLQTTPCRGVQRGSGESLAIVGETLYYKSPTGICAYDGSLPTDISRELGRKHYRDAVAGSIGSKYYICMADAETSESCLFVYDAEKALWHREDSIAITRFCTARDVLYGLERDTGKIWAMAGIAEGEEETNIPWMAQTGMIGGSTPDAKYLVGLTVRMGLTPGSTAEFAVRYDSMGDWETVGRVESQGISSFSVPIRPRRCDHLQLRIRGTGMMRIYAVTKTMEQGSDYF